MPLKRLMYERADQLSDAALLSGAVNTIVNRDGVLWGDNTDGYGFMRSMADAGFEARDSHITLLGSGGAAAAILAQAALDGARAIYDVPDPDDYTDRLMPFYEGLSRSETPAVRDAALSMWCQHGLPFRGVSARMWSGMAKAKAAERCGCFAGTCCGRFLNDVYGWRNVGCQYF